MAPALGKVRMDQTRIRPTASAVSRPKSAGGDADHALGAVALRRGPRGFVDGDVVHAARGEFGAGALWFCSRVAKVPAEFSRASRSRLRRR